LIAGTTYRFKVDARNSHGRSAYSDEISLLCAFVPNSPAQPGAIISGNQIIVAWEDVTANGSPVTGFKLFILKHGSTDYIEETVDCVGTSVFDNRICYVNLDTLTAEPFNLILDEEIYVSVVATNVYGDSALSDPVLAGLMQLLPDAPINLVNVDGTTDATTIRFTWSSGVSDGGATVIDYRIYYDQGTDTQVLLASGLTVLDYTTSVTLTPGTLYSFAITATNSVGESMQSEVLQIYTASTPDAPINLANAPAVTTGYQVGLTWQDGAYDGGSPIIDYQVSYMEVTSSVWIIFADVFAINAGIVTGLTPGLSYYFVVKSRNVIKLSVYSG
jgi:hypothetical protein